MIKRINAIEPGVKRPLRASDLQSLWTGINTALASGVASIPKIICGFDDKGDGNLSSGVVAFNGSLYYHPDVTGSRIAIGSNVYAHELPSNDLRFFADGSQQDFSFDRVANVNAAGGTLIGVFSLANIQVWGSKSIPDNSITLAKLDTIIQGKINRLYEPRQILNFDADPLFSGAVSPSFDSTPPIGAILPFYAEGNAIGNPYPSTFVTGFMIMGKYSPSDEMNFIYVVMSSDIRNGTTPNPKTSDVMAVRKFDYDGTPTQWNYVKNNPMERIFSGDTQRTGTGTLTVNIPPPSTIKITDTLTVCGYIVNTPNLYRTYFSVTFELSTVISGSNNFRLAKVNLPSNDNDFYVQLNNFTSGTLTFGCSARLADTSNTYHITEIYKINN